MLRIKQYCYPTAEGNLPNFTDQNMWSDNLIKNELCYTLGIHSLPGNKFQINDNGMLIINSTGNFTMDFNAYPIYSIRIHKDNKYATYPTILDIVYQCYERTEETRQ